MYLGIIILAVVVALARKGQLKNAQNFKINLWYLLIAALVVYIVLIAGTLANVAFVKDYSYWLYFIVYVLIMITVVFNLSSIWSYLLVLGIALNFTATFLNGGKMPILQSATDMAGSNFPTFLKLFGATNQLTASTPYVMPLCRVIGVPGLPISVGDLVVSVALFMLIQAMLVRPAAKKATPKDIADYTGKLNFTSELKIDEIIQAAGEESIEELDSFLPASKRVAPAIEDDIILGADDKDIDLRKDHFVSNMADDMILGEDATKSLSYQEQKDFEDFLASDKDIAFTLPGIEPVATKDDGEEYDHVLRALDEIKEREDTSPEPLAEEVQDEEAAFVESLSLETEPIADVVAEEAAIIDEDESSLDELLKELEQQAQQDFDTAGEPAAYNVAEETTTEEPALFDEGIEEVEEVQEVDETIDEAALADDLDEEQPELTETEEESLIDSPEEESEQLEQLIDPQDIESDESDISEEISDNEKEALSEELPEDGTVDEVVAQEDVQDVQEEDDAQQAAALAAEEEAAALAAKAQAEAELQQNTDAMLQYMNDLFRQNKQEHDALVAMTPPSVQEDQIVDEIVQITDSDEDTFVPVEDVSSHAPIVATVDEEPQQAQQIPVQQEVQEDVAAPQEAEEDDDEDEKDESVYPFIIENGRIVENKNYRFNKNKDLPSKNLDIEKDAPSIYDSTVNLENIRKEIFEELQRQEQEALSPLASSAQGGASAPQENAAEDLDSLFEQQGAPHRSREAKSALAKDATEEYERVAFEIDGKINYVWIKK